MPVSPPNPLVNNMPDWQRDGADHLWLPYTQMQTTPLGLPVRSARGVTIELEDGRTLIDGISSWWTACHGYSHPHIEQAVAAQLEKLPHVMLGGFQHEEACRLASRLAALTPGDLGHVFFSESGSVSVEVAMKMAIQYWINRGRRGRVRFIAFRGGYHGDTFGAMSVCDPEDGMHTLFRGSFPAQIMADIPDTKEKRAAFERLLEAHAPEAAAVIMEPLVQGAGGMLFHDAETLAYIRTACDRHDLLLITDEIMTGMGRLGTMFACDQADIVPDIMTLSKSLTGGTLPLAATIATSRVFEAFLSDDPAMALMHGPTYMGNPLGCAAANASLDLFETEPRLEQAAAIEKQLHGALMPLKSLPGVRDVRTRGAIGVVEMEDIGDLNWLKRRFVEEGVWIRPFGNIIYTMPPFIIEPGDLSRVTSAIATIVHEATQPRG